jgi:hypothetical protein
MADTRSSEEGTNVHGLFGAIIIEPRAAKWHKHMFLVNGDYEEQVVITTPKVKSYREFVVFIENGIRMLDADIIFCSIPNSA